MKYVAQLEEPGCRALLRVESHRPALSCLVPVWVLVLVLASLTPNLLRAETAEPTLQETFEENASFLDRWELLGPHAISRVPREDDAGYALELRAEPRVVALLRGSEHWGPVRIEFDVLFPTREHAYLGLIYSYEEKNVESGSRIDFGSVYIKGNSNYVRVNPFRDGNVSRLLYEEYKTPLEGDAAIEVGEWQRLAFEVVGGDFHLYSGNTASGEHPILTFSLFEGRKGKIGFNPRVTGGPVRIDNVTVRPIEHFSYSGPPVPNPDYEPSEFLTSWEVTGPYSGPELAIEQERATPNDRPNTRWMPFATDPRGAVVTGRITEYDGSRPVAYFRTIVASETSKIAVLQVSSTEELALWVNGSFHGFIYRNGYRFGERDWNAWFDFWRNDAHAGAEVEIQLEPGDNRIVLRSRNGQFASGGFFARLKTD